MARNKEYIKEDALQKAMRLFWIQGYNATSIQQLMDEMGISRSSMYADFNSKRDLFLEVLALNNKSSTVLFDLMTKGDDPLEIMENVFELGFMDELENYFYYGCLLVNTMLELKGVDDELSNIAAEYLDDIERAFTATFQRCAEIESLSPDLDPATLASYFMTIIKGLRVIARQKPSPEYLRGIMKISLRVF